MKYELVSISIFHDREVYEEKMASQINDMHSTHTNRTMFLVVF